jgi:hypothetical protein
MTPPRNNQEDITFLRELNTVFEHTNEIQLNKKSYKPEYDPNSSKHVSPRNKNQSHYRIRNLVTGNSVDKKQTEADFQTPRHTTIENLTSNPTQFQRDQNISELETITFRKFNSPALHPKATPIITPLKNKRFSIPQPLTNESIVLQTSKTDHNRRFSYNPAPTPTPKPKPKKTLLRPDPAYPAIGPGMGPALIIPWQGQADLVYELVAVGVGQFLLKDKGSY